MKLSFKYTLWDQSLTSLMTTEFSYALLLVVIGNPAFAGIELVLTMMA